MWKDSSPQINKFSYVLLFAGCFGRLWELFEKCHHQNFIFRSCCEVRKTRSSKQIASLVMWILINYSSRSTTMWRDHVYVGTLHLCHHNFPFAARIVAGFFFFGRRRNEKLSRLPHLKNVNFRLFWMLLLDERESKECFSYHQLLLFSSIMGFLVVAARTTKFRSWKKIYKFLLEEINGNKEI